MLEGDYKYYHNDIAYIKPLVWKSDAIASICPISNEAVIKPYIYIELYKMQFDSNWNVHAMSSGTHDLCSHQQSTGSPQTYIMHTLANIIT